LNHRLVAFSAAAVPEAIGPRFKHKEDDGCCVRMADASEHDIRAESFTRLYREQSDKIFGLCLRMSGDSARATELAQDVFIRVWRNFDRMRPGSDSGAWVWRLAINVVLNGMRSDRRLRAREHLVADVSPHLKPQTPATPIPLRRIALESALRTLPPKARRVYLLHDVEGYSHDECAKLLQVAPGTVRSQLHRARRLMRAVLE
jgi:RNA polymerase sigma-70 factor (ECF subfamily)